MTPDISLSGRRYMMFASAAVCFALGLQFYLTTNLIVAQGGRFVSGVFFFLDFFTILTNIMVAAALVVPLIAGGSRLAEFLQRPVVLGAIASYIVIVGVSYRLLLLSFRPAGGLSMWADILLHDISPLLFVIFWLVFVPKGSLHWRHAFLWLGYPLAYVVYAFLRASFTGRYPYPFLDVAVLGYARVFANMAMLTGGFLIIGLVFVVVDGFLGRRKIE